MPAAAESGPRPCSIASALDVIGEKWTLLVLREVHYGVRRFDEIQRRTGAPRAVLTQRLNRLVEFGVLEKRAYTARPPRFEYLPTQAGTDLRPVLLLLDAWGTTWLPDAVHSDAVITHECGETVQPFLACRACGGPITGADLTAM